MSPRLLQRKDTYTFDYPEAIEFADMQNKIFWLFDEIALEKDIQDVLVYLSPAEKHGILYVLRLFTRYELVVGSEYWSGKVKKWFKRPDIALMADCFTFFETNVHARFYNRINELLHLNTDEFFDSYKDDPILVDRVAFLDEIVASENKLLSLAVFSMIEGAILYSSFAFIKHFQSNGKNRLSNLVAGINFSVRDENIHSIAGAWLFRTLAAEMGVNVEQMADLKELIYDAARKLRDHEHRIVDQIFSFGQIDGITAHQMKVFVDSRINLCLVQLGFDDIFTVGANPIAEWFYNGINSYVFHDFFQKVGREYSRDYDEEKFNFDRSLLDEYPGVYV